MRGGGEVTKKGVRETASNSGDPRKRKLDDFDPFPHFQTLFRLLQRAMSSSESDAVDP